LLQNRPLHSFLWSSQTWNLILGFPFSSLFVESRWIQVRDCSVLFFWKICFQHFFIKTRSFVRSEFGGSVLFCWLQYPYSSIILGFQVSPSALRHSPNPGEGLFWAFLLTNLFSALRDQTFKLWSFLPTCSGWYILLASKSAAPFFSVVLCNLKSFILGFPVSLSVCLNSPTSAKGLFCGFLLIYLFSARIKTLSFVLFFRLQAETHEIRLSSFRFFSSAETGRAWTSEDWISCFRNLIAQFRFLFW